LVCVGHFPGDVTKVFWTNVRPDTGGRMPVTS